MEEYEKLAEENLIPLHDDPELPQKLVGSFRVAVGERQDEVWIQRRVLGCSL